MTNKLNSVKLNICNLNLILETTIKDHENVGWRGFMWDGRLLQSLGTRTAEARPGGL